MAKTSEDRSQFLKALAEQPSIFYACKKAGIARAAVYRWMKSNPEFKKQVSEILRYSRPEAIEKIELTLFKKALGGDMAAIKYWLPHNSEKYRPQRPITPLPYLPSDVIELLRGYEEQLKRNKPLSPEQLKMIGNAMINCGLVDANGNPTAAFHEITHAKATNEKPPNDLDPPKSPEVE